MGNWGLRSRIHADAHGLAPAAPGAGAGVESAGNRRAAMPAATVLDIERSKLVAVALDRHAAAPWTLCALVLAVADVSGVDIVQSGAARNVVGRKQRAKRCRPAVGQL